VSLPDDGVEEIENAGACPAEILYEFFRRRGRGPRSSEGQKPFDLVTELRRPDRKILRKYKAQANSEKKCVSGGISTPSDLASESLHERGSGTERNQLREIPPRFTGMGLGFPGVMLESARNAICCLKEQVSDPLASHSPLMTVQKLLVCKLCHLCP